MHYMDDILICAPRQSYLDWTLTKVVSALQTEGFEIQEEKVQRVSPWKYLGLLISDKTIVPQQIVINDKKDTPGAPPTLWFGKLDSTSLGTYNRGLSALV